MNFISISEQMPRCEELILVAGINEYGAKKILRAIYARKHTVISSSDDDNHEYDEETDEYYLKEGFYETNEFEDIHWYIDFEILYWMPLPEYPKHQ